MHNAILEIPRRTGGDPYFIEGGADVAETTYRPFGQRREVRLIVRRVRPTPGSQLASLPSTTTTPLSPTGKARPSTSRPTTDAMPSSRT